MEMILIILITMHGKHIVGLRNCKYFLPKYEYKNCIVRASLVQNFEVSISEKRYFPSTSWIDCYQLKFCGYFFFRDWGL
jgi:hypothetical protein